MTTTTTTFVIKTNVGMSWWCRLLLFFFFNVRLGGENKMNGNDSWRKRDLDGNKVILAVDEKELEDHRDEGEEEDQGSDNNNNNNDGREGPLTQFQQSLQVLCKENRDISTLEANHLLKLGTPSSFSIPMALLHLQSLDQKA